MQHGIDYQWDQNNGKPVDDDFLQYPVPAFRTVAKCNVIIVTTYDILSK